MSSAECFVLGKQAGERPHPRRRGCCWSCVVPELIPGMVCSIATTSYTLNEEAETGNSSFGSPANWIGGDNAIESTLGLLLRPSPGLMLGSCLVLGCSISSFVYRRQETDPFQGVIFFCLILWAVALGSALDASENLIMLGFVPWAFCAGMPLSVTSHSIARWLQSRRAAEVEARDEKTQLLP